MADDARAPVRRPCSALFRGPSAPVRRRRAPAYEVRLTAVYLIALVAMVAPLGAAAQERPLWHGLEPGAHEVGFTRIWSLDRARVWPRSRALDSVGGSVARPIRIDVWYPASCDDRGRMELEEYFEMEAPGPEFEDLVFLTRRWDEYSYRGLAPDSTVFDEFVAIETAACRDAPRSPGRFPLVVYSAGWYNRAPDNTVLLEYLASHGFVAATVPQLNPGLWTFHFRSDATSVENQVRDLEFALGELLELDRVDRRRLAALGYSTGGDVALLLANRNPLVDLVVGLDPSWALGADNDVAGSPLFRAEDHETPVCVLRREPATEAEADALLDSLRAAPRLLIEIPDADHGTFSDDPVQRRFLGEGSEASVRVHGTATRAVRACLSEALALPSGSVFDGSELATRLRSLDVRVRLLPPEPDRDDP